MKNDFEVQHELGYLLRKLGMEEETVYQLDVDFKGKDKIIQVHFSHQIKVDS